MTNFNPRSPWGERLRSALPSRDADYFNPRSPWGERRENTQSAWVPETISIHAPRGGSDRKYPVRMGARDYFNPRSPWGERPDPKLDPIEAAEFQSTLPVGGATKLGAQLSGQTIISIHAPRGGSDGSTTSRTAGGRDFNPRSPWGERRLIGLISNFIVSISIHAPRGGSDNTEQGGQHNARNFNPRSPWGERQQRCTVLGAHLWRRYIIFAHFREIGLSAWAASGESGGKQRSKSRANLPGIFCLPGLRNQRIRGASGI